MLRAVRDLRWGGVAEAGIRRLDDRLTWTPAEWDCFLASMTCAANCEDPTARGFWQVNQRAGSKEYGDPWPATRACERHSCSMTPEDSGAPHTTARRLLGRPKRELHQQLTVIDSIVWASDHLLPVLSVTSRNGSAVIHPTCPMRHLGVVDNLRQVAGACADDVTLPVWAECGGFAGDRGMLHKELTRPPPPMRPPRSWSATTTVACRPTAPARSARSTQPAGRSTPC